jgi:hypothetical protein
VRGVKAHLEHALQPEGFYLRVRLVVCRRYATPGGSRFRFSSGWPAGNNSARTPLTYKEASRRGKVIKNFRIHEGTFTVLWTSKLTEWHASDTSRRWPCLVNVRCVGKGRKERCTPLTTTTVAVLKAWLRRVLQLARLLDLLRSSFVLASSMVSLPGLHNGLPQCCPSLSGGGGETSQEK